MGKHWREMQLDAFVGKAESKKLRPITKNHELYFKAIEKATIVISCGPAGTGKTYIACGLAAEMLKSGQMKKIVITRPMVACGKGMGFLPGTVDEKFLPYVRPLMDAFEDFFRPDELERFIRDGMIEMWPLDLMRGASIKNTVIICDEAQNAEINQLHMLLTRFGVGSKVIVAGDATISQTDLTHDGINPMRDMIERFRRKGRNPAIEIIQLTRADIVRHPLIQWVDEAFTESSDVVSCDDYDLSCSWCGQEVFYQDDEQQELDQVKCWSCQGITNLYKDNDYSPHKGQCIDGLCRDGHK